MQSIITWFTRYIAGSAARAIAAAIMAAIIIYSPIVLGGIEGRTGWNLDPLGHGHCRAVAMAEAIDLSKRFPGSQQTIWLGTLSDGSGTQAHAWRVDHTGARIDNTYDYWQPGTHRKPYGFIRVRDGRITDTYFLPGSPIGLRLASVYFYSFAAARG